MMMTLKNLVCLSAMTAAAIGCDVKQDLGESASGTESGSGTNGTTGVADTGVLETGEAGSGTTKSGGATGSEESGVLDTGPGSGSSSDTGDETGGPLDDCEPGDAAVRWDSTTITGETVGFSEFAAVSGSCESTGQVFDGSIFTLSVQCDLGGTVDGSPTQLGLVDLDLVIEIEGPTGDILPAFGPGLGISLWVTDTGFGLGTERHVILVREVASDEVVPVMLLADSQRLTPDGVDNFWGDVALESVEATCAAEATGRCGEGRGLAAGWMDALPQVAHAGQSIAFDAGPDVGTYNLFVERAWQAEDASSCPKDGPTAHYKFVAFSDLP